jgi:hypothetical protein
VDAIVLSAMVACEPLTETMRPSSGRSTRCGALFGSAFMNDPCFGEISAQGIAGRRFGPG